MKSHVSDLISIAHSVYLDACAKCITSQDEHDINTISKRVRHEGLSFLTITLATFGQDFERSLDRGYISPSDFQSFRKSGAIPSFLKGMLGLVFNPNDGRLLNNADISAIEGVRQIAYTFKKLEIPYTAEKLDKAISNYVEDERSCRFYRPSQHEAETFRTVSRACWSSILGAICVRDTIPKHGPGATADHISGNQKYADRCWHRRLEPYFPFFNFKVPNETLIEDWKEDSDKISELSEDEELPVRVVFVPKNGKGPRTIAMEPVCMQYAQQALCKSLVSALESSKLTSGHVNFTDQTINRELAIAASTNRSYATLDLSSASDRVPWSMVKIMLDSCPEFLGAVSACRSKNAELPNGLKIPLAKFASMGSALCFPIESMYFYTICILALLGKYNLPPSGKNLYKVSRKVFVYGDDIIVDNEDVSDVVAALQRYNCKVNTTKSFWNGNFRESCGIDAYRGYEVTPTYLRQVPPYNRQMASNIISWTATSNLFHLKGYWLTAELLVKRVEKLLGKLPVVHETCSGLGKISFLTPPLKGRWDDALHTYKVRMWVPSPVYQRDKLDGIPALMKCLLRLEQLQCAPIDSRHLERSARHGAVTLKRRWMQPF